MRINNKEIKAAILKNETHEAHYYWVAACKRLDLKYKVIDITLNNWLYEIRNGNFDIFLTVPPGTEEKFKKLYDEKIYILDKVLKYKVYPSYDEISIHENKKYLSFWLNANNLPHPQTDIFYFKKEALNFLQQTKYPIVGKFNIGASGKGVNILKNQKSAFNYVETAFSPGGLIQDFGPNLKMGNTRSRIKKLLENPASILKKLRKYKTLYKERQKGWVLLQQYVPHLFEWRVVKIGISYFGHQKIKTGDKASGTKGINYESPPIKLLDFVRNICEKYNFNSMAVDLFEDGNGGYLINEMQTVFGHVQEYICEKNGKPGRFSFLDGNWQFEEGYFNSNLSYDLRLEDAISILNKAI